jgi:hypothetical protein
VDWFPEIVHLAILQSKRTGLPPPADNARDDIEALYHEESSENWRLGQVKNLARHARSIESEAQTSFSAETYGGYLRGIIQIS